MKKYLFHSSKKKAHEMFRALTYSSSVTAVFFILIYIKNLNFNSTLSLLSLVGLALISLEAFFTNFHADAKHHQFYANLKSAKNRKLFLHSLNHLAYPILYYVFFTLYLRHIENLHLVVAIGFITFPLYFAYFYLVRTHIIKGHFEESKTDKIRLYKVDTLMDVFKFGTYFLGILAFFELYNDYKISELVLYTLISGLTTLLLLFHLNRRHLVSYTSLFLALVFGILTSVFILRAHTNVESFNGAIATLIFYLTSGIYQHKADGTLTPKIILEYLSIAIILSVFLFTI